MIHQARLIRCAEHSTVNCWVQTNGTHKDPADCTCSEEKPPYLCPIDAHSIKYLLENPEWEVEAPKRHAPKPKPQDCEHRACVSASV